VRERSLDLLERIHEVADLGLSLQDVLVIPEFVQTHSAAVYRYDFK
jgi:hypothetical protein